MRKPRRIILSRAYKSPTLHQIHYLAGLLEGEGCFSHVSAQPRITLLMSDRDIIEQAGGIMTTKALGPYQYGKAHYKPVYRIHIHGARALAWMFTLYPLLGKRRRARIREVVELHHKKFLEYKKTQITHFDGV